MHLSVVTPERTLVDTEVTEVYAPGTVGELGVLPDHITFLGTLGTGEIRYRTQSGSGRLLMSGGVVEVIDNRITILADQAVSPEEVDAEVARRELAEAESTLESQNPADASYAAAESARRWAQLRLDGDGQQRS